MYISYALSYSFKTFVNRCLVNCQARVVPSMKLSLTLDCTGCNTLGLQYKWSLDIKNGTNYKPMDLDAIARTGMGSIILV